MNTRPDCFEETDCLARAPSERGVPRGSTVMAVRRAVFALMRLLRPLVSLGSLLLALVCVALLVFSLTFPPGTHFPVGLVGGLALSCVGFNYAYSYLMSLVLPSRTVEPAARTRY